MTTSEEQNAQLLILVLDKDKEARTALFHDKKISQLDLNIKDNDLLENLQKFVDEVRDYSTQNFSKASPKRKLSFAEEDKTVKKKQKQNNNANFDDVKDKYKEMHLFLIQCLSGCVVPLEKVEKDDKKLHWSIRRNQNIS